MMEIKGLVEEKSRSRVKATKQAPGKHIVILIMLMSSLFTNCQRSQSSSSSITVFDAHGWKLLQHATEDPANWKVYSRKVKGSSFKAYKISGKIDVRPSEAVAALRYKTENSKVFLSEKEGFIKVLENTPDELLAYSVYCLPFPFRDRAMCERFMFSSDSTSGMYSISWVEDWQSAPPAEKGVVRMPIARGSWTFEPLGADSSIATYLVYTEPGGTLPAWMVNQTVKKGMEKALHEVASLANHLKQAK